MNINNKIIGYDFQGWPIKRLTCRELKELINNIPEEHLDEYVEIYEDDGMGYSPHIKYITDVYDKQIWIDSIQYCDLYEDKNHNEILAFQYWGTPDCRQRLSERMHNYYNDGRIPESLEVGDFIIFKDDSFEIIKEDIFYKTYKTL